MKRSIDLNCDLGEGFGVYKMDQDAELMKIVTSANIACGFHAGDPRIMRETVKLAMEHNISIGAHPGLPDLIGFGRRQIDIDEQDAYDIVLYQIGALSAIVRAEGGELRHVKPHGALYNMAAIDEKIANGIARAVYRFDQRLILFGLSGSALTKAGERIGLRVAHEVFADRAYQADGSLASRKQPNSLITDSKKAVEQALRFVKEGKVRSVEGLDVSLKADTICIHGDGPTALSLAQNILKTFRNDGISVHPIA